MPGQTSNPTDPHLNINPPPPSASLNANAPYTPRSSSIADDSDAEFEPTPVHSPAGPQYDDLPPSYDEAQQQAVADVRNGIAPLDPNQIEAHRLTLNEGPNQPEIWEYRVRGEQIEPEHDHELAPEYESHVNSSGTAVPVQHVESSSNIPVGQVNSRNHPQPNVPDPTAVILDRALEFTRHEPDADVQYAPRLTRVIAIPQEGLNGRNRRPERRGKARRRDSKGEPSSNDNSSETVQFLRAYAKALHTHSIRPAEFTEFLDGLNALCEATSTSAEDLSHELSSDAPSGPVHDYIRGANEAFFAPRGLRVSLRSLPALLQALNIPTERGQRAGAVASVLDQATTADKRARALYPWIEALETNVPEPSTHTLTLREMSYRFRSQGITQETSYSSQDFPSEKGRAFTAEEEHADPPHSIPEPGDESHQNFGPWGPGRRGFGGRGGRRGGPWTPFGAPGRGPFGAPGNGPFGGPGRGPFGAPGHGPFGRPGRGLFGPPGFGPRGGPHCGRGRGNARSYGPGSSQNPNDWATWGENIGKLGEEFGKMMGDWGQQLGRRAEAWGQDVGRRAETWGEEISARASGSGTQPRNGHDSAQTQSHEDPPPSYPEGLAGQETGVLHGDRKVDTTISEPKKDDEGQKSKGHDDDDDASSVSSDSSDSDSDSDSDDEEYPDTSAIFLARIRSINEQADLSAKKGKKSPEEVANERALAIEKAQNEKTALEVKIEETQTKRAIRSSLRQRGREMKKEYRQRKREMRERHVGKGKGKAKKSKEWREVKRDYREKKKALRKEKMTARKEWREARYERRKLYRERGSVNANQEEVMKSMTWVVIENLAP